MRNQFLQASSAVALALVLTAATEARQSGPADNGAVVSYETGFFDRFNPVTALDMVQQMPGFTLSAGDAARRGLGDSFGNLLINGERPSNKSLTLETVLGRIPANSVVRIELIQEALPQFDMRGHARLANVIVEDNGSSGAWSVTLERSDSNRIGPRGNISWSTQLGSADITMSLNGELWGNRGRIKQQLYTSGGTELTETRRINEQFVWAPLRSSLSMNMPLGTDTSLRLDAFAETWVWHLDRWRQDFDPYDLGAGPTALERGFTENHGSNFNISPTLAHTFNERWSGETTLLVRRDRERQGPHRFNQWDAGTGFVGATIIEGDYDLEETALRQTFSWSANERHSLEFGAETALNSRDSDLRLFSDDGAVLSEIELPVSTTRVEEDRQEVFTTHTWTLSESLQLESGLRVEFSEITQSGDAEQSRSFEYLKPRAVLTWRQDAQTRWRFSVLRDVAQLQFGKFASTVDLNDDTSVVGNPDYVPQRSWVAEAEWERRFGDNASLSITARYSDVQDLDGWLAGERDGSVFDTPGNIGDASRLDLLLSATTPLDAMGVSNAVLDIDLSWNDTEVTDPLTGDTRRWSGPREWGVQLDFRQDLPVRQLAWGWDFSAFADSEAFRAREYRALEHGERSLNAFVETTRFAGVSSRLGVRHMFGNIHNRERVFFNGSRAVGIISAVEHEQRKSFGLFYITFSGAF